MTEEVIFSPPAKKYFKKLKDKVLLQLFFDKIEQIADNPYEVGEPKTGDLAGIMGWMLSIVGVTMKLLIPCVKMRMEN